MKDFRQTKTTHLTLLPFIVRRYREFECRLYRVKIEGKDIDF